MGFWDSVKMDKVTKQAEYNGLWKGGHTENCSNCTYSRKADCVTGLVCSGRTFNNTEYMIVPASYVCENFRLPSTY